MLSKYQLRSSDKKIGSMPPKFDQDKYNQLLKSIFPSKYMDRKASKIEDISDSDYDTEEDEESFETESDTDSDYESESESEPLQVNITFTLQSDESDSDYEPESESEEDTDEMEVNDKVMETLAVVGKELTEKFKDSPLLAEYNSFHEKQSISHQRKKEKKEKSVRSKNLKSFDDLLTNKTALNDSKYFKSTSLEEQQLILSKLHKINELSYQEKPNRIRLIESTIPDEYKVHALKKMNSLKKLSASDGEYYKLKHWIDAFMQIPFGTICKLPVQMSDGPEKCHEFMKQAKDYLDQATYGLNDAKMQIMQYIGQVISNPNAFGTAIAIKGPMGTGKTTLVKEGISKILQRPFAFIALGGATDSSTLEGHSITYEGSVWGQIVDVLMKCKCMNPVFYFDELDKISDTPKGEEIIGILTHLTDLSQNDRFHDKYFSEIEFDLSKALFIFSYNDESKVNAILRDRMFVIKTEGYTSAQKLIIAKNYLTKSIRENINFEEGQINITDEAIQYMIENYTDNEKGVRNLKRCIENIYTKLNLFRLMNPGTNLFEDDISIKVEFPFVVNTDMVRKLIKKMDEKPNYMMYS